MQKIRFFLAKIEPLFKAIMWELCWKFFSSVFIFLIQKNAINENISFVDYTSRIRLLDYSKLKKIAMTSQFFVISMTSSSDSLDVFLLLVLSSLVTGPCFVSISSLVLTIWVMTICFYKALTRYPKIRNIPAWVFPNIWKLAQIRNTKLGANVPNKILLNAAKYEGYRFYRLLLLRENQQAVGGGGGDYSPPQRLGLIKFHLLVTNLESLASFNKFNILWCSIVNIFLLQLMCLKKILE